MPVLRLIFLIFLIAAPVGASADEAPPPADTKAEEAIVQAWGRTHPTCAEWNDGCVVCTQAGCSTPGIACTPREIACSKP